MNKPSPFSKTTKQLRENLSAAMIKAVYRSRECAQPDGDANSPDAGEMEATRKCFGKDGS